MDRYKIYERGHIHTCASGRAVCGTEGNMGELVEVIEGTAEIRAYLWLRKYSELSANNKYLIQAFYPGVEKRLNEKTAMPDKLISSVLGWCVRRESLRIVCSRCGGDGHYSYNQRYGTVCFKCNGAKFALPRMTKAWIDSAAAEYEAYKASKIKSA